MGMEMRAECKLHAHTHTYNDINTYTCIINTPLECVERLDGLLDGWPCWYYCPVLNADSNTDFNTPTPLVCSCTSNECCCMHERWIYIYNCTNKYWKKVPLCNLEVGQQYKIKFTHVKRKCIATKYDNCESSNLRRKVVEKNLNLFVAIKCAKSNDFRKREYENYEFFQIYQANQVKYLPTYIQIYSKCLFLCN